MTRPRYLARMRVLSNAAVAVVMACALLLGGLPARRALAERPPDEAVELYKRGSEHYRAGRYREAIADLKAALELDPDSPNLVYNVARVSELLGNISEAIEYYQRYVELLPASQEAERQEARATIRRLEGARDQVAAQADSGALREPIIVEVEAPPLGKADIYFWATAGLGAAALGGAAVTGFLALSKERDVRDFVLGPDGKGTDRSQLIDGADRLALTSDILLATGGVSVVAAVGLFFLRDPESPRPPQATQLDVSIGTRSVALSGRF